MLIQGRKYQRVKTNLRPTCVVTCVLQEKNASVIQYEDGNIEFVPHHYRCLSMYTLIRPVILENK